MKALTHPRTQKQIESYINQPFHGLIISGPEGSGKYYLATEIATNIADEYITVAVLENKSTISIEQIRELYSLTKTGTSLAIIVKEAHTMGTEAQNAFLKLLEEPPQNTTFILTTIKPDLLLSTICSRSQLIEVLPPANELFITEVSQRGINVTDIQALLHTTRRLPGKFFSLLETEEAANYTEKVDQAKQFYAANSYVRHKICQEHGYEKIWAEELLSLLSIIIQALLKQDVSHKNRRRLLDQAELLETTSVNILQLPGNPKIHLAKLCEEL